MEFRTAALSCCLTATLAAQTVTVDASGSLTIRWQGSGSVQSVSQPIVGTTALQVGSVGTAAVTVGSTAAGMVLEAFDPPWPGPTMGWWSESTGSATFKFVADMPVAGVLRLHSSPACIVSQPPTFDVENDGERELVAWSGAATVDIPVVLTPRPIPVWVYDDTVNFGYATCVATSSVEFLPQATELTVAGVACGAQLGASALPPTSQPGVLTLHVADDPVAPSSLFAAIAFGSAPLPLGSACNPGLIADGWIGVVPAAGGLDLPIPLPAGLRGFVHLQYVGLQLPFLLQWSNRMTLTLP